MANEEHLAILKQGVEVWNKWRETNPSIWPNLDRAELMGANLSEADFYRASFLGANLSGTKLRRANLTEAMLLGANLSNISVLETGSFFQHPTRPDTGTDLSGANLKDTNLVGTNFSNAQLKGANLSGALLEWANFSGANFSGANLSEAGLGWTILVNLDLSMVTGLDAAKHRGPSYIDIDTIYRSNGDIPEAFLRGCGVPDTFIEFARSLALAERPIDYYSCFISYSSNDEDFAQRLHADLQANGVRCWFAPEDMKIGDKIRQRIDESIRIHDKLLLVLSENSNDSQWVEKEVETAWEEERKRGQTVLFPVRLDDSVFETDQAWAADVRRQRHIGDFREWKKHDSYQEAFGRLLRDLKAES